MSYESHIDYNRIAIAIEYISTTHLSQPPLDEVAAKVGLTGFHFQRLFTRWAGISPKKFLQYVTISHARQMLRDNATLFDTAADTGLSGTGRLHDLFIRFESMTPGEYKNGGASLNITFNVMNSIYGEVVIAKTDRGICFLEFSDSNSENMAGLYQKFPNARFIKDDDPIFHEAIRSFTEMPSQPLKLHIKSSAFQLKVWEALLKIPAGSLSVYGALARHLNMPGASRAVGTAIGSNPVAVLIPCHRVIQATGLPGGYHWGVTRKKIILAREAATSESKEKNMISPEISLINEKE